MMRMDRRRLRVTFDLLRTAAFYFVTAAGIGCAAVPPPVPSTAPGAVHGESSAEASGRAASKGFQSGYLQGLSYLEQGQLESAQRVFESLIKSDPNRAGLHNALGILFRRRGMLEKSIAEYKMAIALVESPAAVPSGRTASSELYNNLAIAYREQGEFKKAEEAYQKAIKLDPKFEAAYYNLGVLYDLYLNQPSDAVRNYRDYERLSGQNQTVDVWIEDLEQRAARKSGNTDAPP
jgi:tetratricopeptide (TPR) repeat protein